MDTGWKYTVYAQNARSQPLDGNECRITRTKRAEGEGITRHLYVFYFAAAARNQ